jgi:hypothetical protein
MAKILDKTTPDSLGKSLDGQLFGTAPYMAPEQFLERGADPRMDVYAAGCILTEMLTGKPPFSGGMAVQMDQHLRVKPDAPSRRQPASGITPDLDEVVLRCLAKQPDQRFADAGALADALEELGGAPQIHTQPMRKTKIGVTAQLDDFLEEDTQRGTTDPGPAVEPSGPTEALDPDQAAEAAAAVLEEIADQLVDLGVADAFVVAGAAHLRDLRRRIARLRNEAGETDSRAQAYEQSVREREASLTFAVGELAFDRDRGDPITRSDIAEQIEVLERSLSALANESKRQLGTLDDQALVIAATLHDDVEEYAMAARRVVPGVLGAIDRIDDEPAAAPLRRRLATARSLLGC